MKDRFKAIGAVFGVFIKDGKLLMLRRQNTGFADGCYSLPAGHLEVGESVMSAALRELKEEVDVAVTAEQLTLVHVQSYNADDGHRIHFFFRIAEPYQEPRNMEPDKCDHLSWFPLDTLPNNTIPYIRDVLEHIQRGELYSDEGWS